LDKEWLAELRSPEVTEGLRDVTDDQEPRSPVESWLARTLLTRRLSPLAFFVIFAGCAISIAIRTQGRTLGWDDLLLSNLASSEENPNGWLVAVVSTTLGGILLLTSAALFIGTFKRLRSGWGTAGALLYFLGTLAIIAWAVSTPLTKGYSSFHIQLSYFAYMSSVGGLGICHTVIALRSNSVPLLSVGSSVLLSAAFLVLIYFFFNDAVFDRHFWLLPVSEWIAGILLASTTTTLAYGAVRLASSQMDRE